MSVGFVGGVDLISEPEDLFVGVLSEGLTRDPVANGGGKLLAPQTEDIIGTTLCGEDWLALAQVFHQLLGQG